MPDPFSRVKHIWDDARAARKLDALLEQGEQPNNPPVGCGHGGNPDDVCSDCSFTPSLAPRDPRCAFDGCDNDAGGTSGYCDDCIAAMLPDDD